MPRTQLAHIVAPQEVTFGETLWTPEFAAEVAALAARHFEEVDGGVEPRRQLSLDHNLFAYGTKIGALKIFTVRVDEALAGYLTWNISYDVESKGLMIATQGAWYTDREFSSCGLGLRLFKYTIPVLQSLGVRCIFPHHRTQGRGTEQRLGRWLERQGAKKTQITYTLWIGE